MITENYIKMCEQAEEIQKVWRKSFKNYLGDLFWKGKEYLMIPEACSFVTEIMFEPDDDYIWLPTQEQLWKEVWDISEASPAIAFTFGITKCLTVIALCVGKYIDGEGYEKIYSGGSINECLLQFIYKEKYHKFWTGEKWVKAND